METVTAEQLQAEILRRRYRDLLQKPEAFPSRENWEYIIANRMHGLASLLYHKYLVSVLIAAPQRSIHHRAAIEMFPQYLSAIPRTEAMDALYSDLDTATDATLDLIANGRFFSASHIERLFAAGAIEMETVRELILTEQPEYTAEDLRDMESLLELLDNMPQLGEISLSTSMFSSETRYICPCGHSNPGDSQYCRRTDCQMDICGRTPEDNRAIHALREKTATLREMLHHLPD